MSCKDFLVAAAGECLSRKCGPEILTFPGLLTDLLQAILSGDETVPIATGTSMACGTVLWTIPNISHYPILSISMAERLDMGDHPPIDSSAYCLWYAP